jgi:ATP-binding cassette subfamily B protein
MNEGLTNIEEVMNILDEKPDIQDSPQATPLDLTNGVITFENVSFGYDPRRPILQDISFEIPAKKTVAIVGASGAGKSTIAKLLFRYNDVSNGRILIDNQDIREVTQSSLQSAIGIVPQHTALFNDTLRSNLAYGRLNATDAEIQNAIEHAHLAEFISSLPDGLNTIVGEHGLKLSGGERQRVAIARVLLKNPAVLIFDEATSSLDTKTEHAIQENMEEISRHATTLMIAHRLSTVVHADEILVVDHGCIVERGTHKALLKQGGFYAQLWEKQTHEKQITDV